MIQKRSDAQESVTKASRSELNQDFIAGYRSLVVPHLTSAYASSLPENVAFLCVESTDEACHRSVLLALLKEFANE